MCLSKSEFRKKNVIQKVKSNVSRETEPKAVLKKERKWNENPQKNLKKRKHHPESNPAVDTEMKPELIVSHFKQTENGDIPLKPKVKA